MGSAAYFWRCRFMGPRARAKVLGKGQPKTTAQDVLIFNTGWNERQTKLSERPRTTAIMMSRQQECYDKWQGKQCNRGIRRLLPAISASSRNFLRAVSPGLPIDKFRRNFCHTLRVASSLRCPVGICSNSRLSATQPTEHTHKRPRPNRPRL